MIHAIVVQLERTKPRQIERYARTARHDSAGVGWPDGFFFVVVYNLILFISSAVGNNGRSSTPCTSFRLRLIEYVFFFFLIRIRVLRFRRNAGDAGAFVFLHPAEGDHRRHPIIPYPPQNGFLLLRRRTISY